MNQLLWRLAVSAMAHVLSRYVRRAPLPLAPPATSIASASKAAATPVATTPCSCHPQKAPSQASGNGGVGRHMEGTLLSLLDAPAPTPRAYTCRAALSATAAAAAAAVDGAEGVTGRKAQPPARTLKPGGDPAVTGAAGEVIRLPPGAPPTYRSPVRRLTARIKIPFAEPEQLGPGYVERLQQLSAQRGLQLTGVYLRAGCIELLIDEEAWPAVAARAGGAGGLEALLAEVVAEAARGEGPGGGGPLPAWDLDAVIAALQLQPPPPPDKQPADSAAGAAGPVQATVPLGRPAAAPSEEPRRVLSIQPRVLRLPPPGAQRAAAGGGASAAAARVSVLVSCPVPAPAVALQESLEVLVRCRGAYLRAAASPRTTTASELLYDLQVFDLPEEAGALLVEFRWGGRLARAVPLLLLPAAGSRCATQALADELESLAAAWLGPREELDELLLDLAALLGAPEAAAEAPLPLQLAALAAHMLSYAQQAGLDATAGYLRAALAAPRVDGGGGSRAACGGPEALDGGGGSSQAAAAAARPGGRCGGPGRSLLLSSMALAAGWDRAPEAEEEAYQAYAAPIVLAQAHAIQAVEVMSLLALLFRARHDLFSPSNLTSLAGCAVGTATALAWPLLPRRRWVAMVDAAKIPRYLAYMTAKVMIAWFGFPAPPGIVPYQLGPAMLVMEGLLLPGSCLLPLRTTLLITLAKWPLGVGMALSSGACDTPLQAALLCGRVVLLAMATTLACHTYLRLSYARWAAAASARRAAHKAGKDKKAD